MAHYNRAEWQAYKDDLIKAKQKIVMEEHLYQCNLCLDIYLQTIELSEVEQAESLLRENFSSQILKSVKAFKKSQPRASGSPKSSASEKTRLLLYYAAAASIAVFFTFNGYFDAFTDKIPAKIGGLPVLETKLARGAPGGWSSTLVEKTSDWIDILIDNKEATRE
ncbi:MAG: hypothetical protein WDA53_00495 [Bacillota bacterium]